MGWFLGKVKREGITKTSDNSRLFHIAYAANALS